MNSTVELWPSLHERTPNLSEQAEIENRNLEPRGIKPDVICITITGGTFVLIIDRLNFGNRRH